MKFLSSLSQSPIFRHIFSGIYLVLCQWLAPFSGIECVGRYVPPYSRRIFKFQLYFEYFPQHQLKFNSACCRINTQFCLRFATLAPTVALLFCRKSCGANTFSTIFETRSINSLIASHTHARYCMCSWCDRYESSNTVHRPDSWAQKGSNSDFHSRRLCT